jgi:ankyrin repeat protein
MNKTPLHVAAREGHKEIVLLLLNGRADVEAKDEVCVLTSLSA